MNAAPDFAMRLGALLRDLREVERQGQALIDAERATDRAEASRDTVCMLLQLREMREAALPYLTPPARKVMCNEPVCPPVPQALSKP